TPAGPGNGVLHGLPRGGEDRRGRTTRRDPRTFPPLRTRFLPAGVAEPTVDRDPVPRGNRTWDGGELRRTDRDRPVRRRRLGSPATRAAGTQRGLRHARAGSRT